MCKMNRTKKSPYGWAILAVFASMFFSALGIWIFGCENPYETFIDGVGVWGAVVIGIIALHQSDTSQKFAQKLSARENSCNIMISNHIDINRMENLGKLTNEVIPSYEESEKYVCLSFENCSNTFLKALEIQWGTSVFKSHLTLSNGMKKNFKIYLPEDLDFSRDIVCNIIFTSCNDEKTFGDFKIRKGNEERKRITYYHFYGTENNNGIDLSE